MDTLLIITLFLSLTSLSLCSAKCDMSADTCEFWLEIGFRLTMMKGKISVFPERGNLYRYDVTDTANTSSIDPSGIVQGDGYEDPRMVIVANGTLPGPPIEVYEGQNVIVHVKNKLLSESTTIHWHGLHQTGTPWMDGVAYVNQCPIGPEQSFTYRFKAKPKGTFWYHSHVGVQRTMGLYGAFIIRPKEPLVMPEFIAVINDWNHDWDSNQVYYRMYYGIYENRTKAKGSKSLDGSFFSMFRFHAGLINGKGRYYDKDGVHNGAPLEVFTVRQGNQYKFRWISTGSLYPFRISIDNHNITIMASDGYDIEHYTAESLIINPGERYDFYITADQPIDNYWIRAVTLEVGLNHTAEAILRYDGSDIVEPVSSRRSCTADDMCVVVNCPFSYYPKTDYTKCVTFDHLKSSKGSMEAPKDNVIEERFLNFAFPGNSWTPGSVNGRAFESPAVSALTQPHELDHYKCGEDCGDQKICKCMYTLNLDHGKVYQMVFMNMGKGKGWSHPIHMHGHSFYVLKMAYGTYNETSGELLGENMDIDCRGNVDRAESFCNDATWSNSSWSGGNVPGLELKNPPRKDTIIVPTGGYVVIRIKADNPGVWFMHCHIELHNMDGMAMMINESYGKHPQAPKDFPKCGDFGAAEYEFEEEPLKVVKDKVVSEEQFWVVTGVLCGIIVLLLIALLVRLCIKEKKNKSQYETNMKGEFNQSFEATK